MAVFVIRYPASRRGLGSPTLTEETSLNWAATQTPSLLIKRQQLKQRAICPGIHKQVAGKEKGFVSFPTSALLTLETRWFFG